MQGYPSNSNLPSYIKNLARRVEFFNGWIEVIFCQNRRISSKGEVTFTGRVFIAPFDVRWECFHCLALFVPLALFWVNRRCFPAWQSHLFLPVWIMMMMMTIIYALIRKVSCSSVASKRLVGPQVSHEKWAIYQEGQLGPHGIGWFLFWRNLEF